MDKNTYELVFDHHVARIIIRNEIGEVIAYIMYDQTNPLNADTGRIFSGLLNKARVVLNQISNERKDSK